MAVSTPGGDDAAVSALVARVLRWSVVDGPGNRMVLFLQGCSFACPGCHNPHTMGHCNGCGDCLPVCPVDALRLSEGRLVFDPGPCTHCDACLDACPVSANPMAQRMDVAQVLAQLRRDAAFIDGITVSGGEATLQPKFVAALFAAVKATPALAHLGCLIDSNGHLGPQGWELLLPVTDGVMLDIKAFDPQRHRRLTGQDNSRALASARWLAQHGKLHELRFLVVPGETDQPDEVAALAALALELRAPVRLNAFRHHGVRGAARQWPSARRFDVEAVAARLKAAGVAPVALPAVWLE
ncbi:MAG: YjjW family glycine radical enzyme activase [Rhodoferax sp.]